MPVALAVLAQLRAGLPAQPGRHPVPVLGPVVARLAWRRAGTSPAPRHRRHRRGRSGSARSRGPRRGGAGTAPPTPPGPRRRPARPGPHPRPRPGRACASSRSPRRSSRTPRRCLRGRMGGGLARCSVRLPAGRQVPGPQGLPGQAGPEDASRRSASQRSRLGRILRSRLDAGVAGLVPPRPLPAAQPAAGGRSCLSPAPPAQRRARADPVRGHGRTRRTWPVPTGRPAHRWPRPLEGGGAVQAHADRDPAHPLRAHRDHPPAVTSVGGRPRRGDRGVSGSAVVVGCGVPGAVGGQRLVQVRVAVAPHPVRQHLHGQAGGDRVGVGPLGQCGLVGAPRQDRVGQPGRPRPVGDWWCQSLRSPPSPSSSSRSGAGFVPVRAGWLRVDRFVRGPLGLGLLRAALGAACGGLLVLLAQLAGQVGGFVDQLGDGGFEFGPVVRGDLAAVRPHRGALVAAVGALPRRGSRPVSSTARSCRSPGAGRGGSRPPGTWAAARAGPG